MNNNIKMFKLCWDLCW